MTFKLDFVDTISSSPTVRLALTGDQPWRTLMEGTRFDPPPLNRAIADTLLVDGEQIPAAAYGNRTITLSLKVMDAYADTAADAFQKLSREINRPTTVLRYQPETSHPVFFRVFRSEYTQFRFDVVEKTATVMLLAQPFAYGLPETLSSVTVSGNPAAVSNPMYWDVTGIKGDVPAATKIVDTTAGLFGEQVALAMRRRGTPSAAPFLVQAEAMTQGTNTTTQPNDANFSGAGNNYSRCTFGTPTMTDRLSTSLPPSDSVDARGQYRVYARVRKSVAGDTIRIALQAGPSGTGSTNNTLTTVTLPAVSTLRMIDLGLLQIPFGADPVTDGPSGTELPVYTGAVLVDLQAARDSGSGNLDLDFLLFVPADDLFAVIDVGNDSIAGEYAFDSHQDLAYASSGTAVDSSSDIVVLGGLPSLAPGVTNRIYLVPLGGPTSVISGTYTIVVTYWPRYLWVRPLTT